MTNLKYIGIFLICILLLFSFEWKTSKFSNYLEEQFTKEYKATIEKLNTDKENYVKEITILNNSITKIKSEKIILNKEKENLNFVIISLNDELSRIILKRDNIKTPGDISEASKILISIGYTNSILECQ